MRKTNLPSRRSCIFQEEAAWQMGLKMETYIELSALSMMDISYILKTKVLEKYDLAMCQISYWNHP